MLKSLRLPAAFLLAAVFAFSQADANKGQIVGTVFDANKAAVPGAKIKLTNANTGLVRELETGDEGQFRAVLLDPGTYNLVSSKDGFAPAELKGITVTVGSAVSVDVVLQVQATSTTVEVSAAMLSEVQPAPSSTVNSTAITNLPINGRRFQDFAVLTPTVQANDGTRGQLSFAGQRAIYSNVMLDGADYNQPFFGGIRGGERSNFILTVPQSAIQEFQVVTTGYTAEYGRSTGGVMNTVTKSGGNVIHGEAFYQNRNRDWSADSPIPVFDPVARRNISVTPSETLSQYGGAIGGPIKKDKLFFFGAVESQKADIPRRSVFPNLVGLAATPLTQPTIDFYRSEEKAFVQDNRATALLGRADYQLTQGHRFTARYGFSDSVENNAATTGGAVNPFSQFALSNEGTEKDRLHNGTAQYTHLINSTTVNDIRFTGSYEVRPRLANSNTPSVASFLGAFGARNFLPTTQDDQRWQLTDSVSLVRGKHSTKFGVDYSRISTVQAFGFNQFGTFNTNVQNALTVAQLLGGNGANGGNRFDAPGVIYDRQIGNLVADFGLTQLAFFGQDSIRVNNKLSLDFGLRWEGQFNPVPVANNTALVDRVRNANFVLGSRLDPTTMKDATNQIMPRFGFAWTPSSARRTVVRGHTGIFYAATPLLVFSGGTNNFRTPPGDVSIRIGGDTTRPSIFNVFQQVGVNLNSSPLSGLPVIPVETVQRAAQIWLGGGTAPDPFNGASVTLNASDYQNPRSFQAGLGVDTEVFRNFIAGIQLNYVNTVHLLRNRNYNLGAPFVNATDASQRPLFTGRQRIGVPSLSQITVRESSARGMYRALTLQGQYRLEKLQLSAFYTLAENYSDADSERDAGGFEYVNSFNLKDEYSFSSQDIRHQFTTNAVYRLPWGFELAGILRANSGLPFTPRTGADTNGDGNNNDRPFLTAGTPVGRNSFRNRSFTRTDMRVLKSFNFRESMRLQVSAEFFNLFNVDNVVFGGNNMLYGAGLQPNGVTAPVNANFMLLRTPDGLYSTNNTQIGNPRQVQLGVRFFF